MSLLLALLAGCCFPFPSDEVERLQAEILQSEPTTLAVARADAAPEIPPLRPGELLPPPTQAGTGLQVLGLAPQGEERDPSQVAVVFDRPMVALQDVDSGAAKVPVRCSPEIPGRARWAGTTTAVLVPEGGRFPTATEFRCEVPAGTAAADGTALEEALTWTFSTVRPRVERTIPSAGTSDWDPKQPLVLRFNQPVDPDALKGVVELREDGGAAVPLSFGRGTGKQDKPEIVVAHGTLAPDTGYTLVAKAGLKGAGGPLPLATDHAVSFRTYPPLRVLDVGPQGLAVDPFDPIVLNFSTRVPAKEVNARIHVSPAPPDGWKPAETYSSSSWEHWVRLAPRTAYTVKVDPGIVDEHGQTLAEGRTWTFTTGDLPPVLDAPEAFLVYPASNPPALPLRHRNVSRLDVALERVDPMAVALDTSDDGGWRTAPGQDARTMRIVPEPALNRAQVAKVDLAPLLVGGRGLVRVRASAPEVRDWEDKVAVSTALLQVTDLGTTLKLGPDGVAVWITRLSDGAPVPDASVRLVRDGAVAWSGVTDAGGLAWAPGDLVPDRWTRWDGRFWVVAQSGDDVALTSHDMDQGLQGWDQGVSGWFDPEQAELQIETFTDRGVYRPGDTVHVQLAARERVLEGLRVPKDRAIAWRFRDPNGQELATGKGTLNDMGAWSLDLRVPADGALGGHGLEVKLGDDEHTAWIDVRAYRAPAFRVDVTAPETATAGDTLQATAHARYLFGTPMAGAKARWSIWREPLALAPEGWEEFSFAKLPDLGEWSDPGGYASVASGEGEMDAEGTLVLKQALPAAELKEPATYTVETTVTDVDRQQVSNRAAVDVHVADAYAGLRARTALGEAGKPVDVDVVAVGVDGKAREGVPVKLTVVRRTWDANREKAMDGTWRWVSTPKDEPAGGGTVSTGAQPAAWRFTPAEGGYYVVRAEGKDRAGRASVAEIGVWVAGGDVSWARGDTRKLELVPDKRRYRPGETARVLVKAPRAGMRALVTVEREGIWSREVVTLKSTADTIQVPITESMMPNAFVTVVGAEGAPPADGPDAGKPGVWYGIAELAVDAKGQKVDVAVVTDKEAYQPRETVKLRVDAKRDGKPLAGARVTLWAVDHGVLSLTAYDTPDLHAAYYQPRTLKVLTADNRIAVYDRAHFLAKGAEAGGGGGDALDGDTRKRFETTPLWAPDLRTGKDGTLAHTFELPDNLTTFRIMAVVDDGKAAFGSGGHEVRVNRPLIARPALPRFFRDGDRVLAGVVVHNNTDAAVDVKVDATAEGAALKGAPRTVSVPARGATEVPFGLTQFAGPSVRFRFAAEGGGNRDAVEADVPVWSPLAQEVVATAGSTTGEARETIALPKDALPNAGGLTVQTSASALVGLGASLDYLVGYPHGCLEQTASELRVAMLARQLGPKAGVETSPEALDTYVRAGLDQMLAFRTPSGGFAYWPGDAQASGLASAYALEVMTEAKAAGHPVDDAVLEGLARAARRFLAGEAVPAWWTPEMTFAAQARTALALARAGRGDAAFNARVWDRRADLPLFAKAQLIEAIARTTGRDARTRALTQEMEAALHVEAADAALVDRDDDAWQALWYGDDVPTAALVRAWMVSDADHPMLPRLAHHLVKARKQGRWANTYTTAEALLALSAYVQRHEAGAVRAEVALGGDTLLSQDLGLGGQKAVFVPMNRLKPGDLLLRAVGGRLYHETRLAYARPELPARDEGFTLARSFEVLEGSGTGGQVAPGSLVRVTLRVVTPVDRYNVAVSDWLPAGLEPVDTTFATTARALAGGADTGGRPTWDTGGFADELPRWIASTWVFNRRELHDDHVSLYADRMPAGIHVQTYLARATTPGEYAHPAATVEEMYAPETFGRTPAGRFVVGVPVAER